MYVRGERVCVRGERVCEKKGTRERKRERGRELEEWIDGYKRGFVN